MTAYLWSSGASAWIEPARQRTAGLAAARGSGIDVPGGLENYPLVMNNRSCRYGGAMESGDREKRLTAFEAFLMARRLTKESPNRRGSAGARLWSVASAGADRWMHNGLFPCQFHDD